MDFTDFFNSLFVGIEDFLQQLADAIIKLLQLLVKVFTFVWNGVQILAKYALKALVSGLKFFKHIWENGLKPLFAKIGDIIGKVHGWLEAHLRPIINWIKKAQAWLEAHVWRPLRAYIQFLQRIRRWLGILRLLHIKWADALDRRLARTEGELAHAFLVVRGVINQVIGWVNAASDPVRLGRMVLVASAGRRATAALVRAITGLPIGFFFPHTGKGSHLYEAPVHSAAALTDPHRNPPASDILLGLAPLSTDGFESADPTPDDATIDGLETTPYFDSLFRSVQDSELFFGALSDEILSVIEAIENRRGLIYEGATPVLTMLDNSLG